MANTWTTLLDAVYPVGAVYMSYGTTSPATLFGGTWSAITGFPWLDSSKTPGTTGGEETHTLSIEEMPRHSHTTNSGLNWDICGSTNLTTGTITFTWYDGGGLEFQKSPRIGGSAAHNNLPPYYVLQGWRRTA